MAKLRHQPVRTCIACREEAGKRQLIRLVRRADGEVVVDATGRLPGRGAYLHPDHDCIEIARKKHSLDRALGAPVQPDVWSQLKG